MIIQYFIFQLPFCMQKIASYWYILDQLFSDCRVQLLWIYWWTQLDHY